MLRFFLRRREPSEQRTLRRIREHFAAFGYDLSDLTDEELRAGIAHLSEVVASSGATMSEAAENLSRAMASLPSIRDWTPPR